MTNWYEKIQPKKGTYWPTLRTNDYPDWLIAEYLAAEWSEKYNAADNSNLFLKAIHGRKK